MAINWLNTSRGTHEHTAFKADKPLIEKKIFIQNKFVLGKKIYIMVYDKYWVIQLYNNDYFVI